MLLKKVWKLKKINMVKIRVNVVQIFFPDLEVMENIIKGRPWCFYNHLLALQRWERIKEYIDSSFDYIYFWIHVGSFPVECYTKELGRKVASMFGECEEIQIRE